MKRPLNLNLLLVLIASWAIPVLWPLCYLFSLLFWALPIAVLLPDFLAATDTPTRRRRWALAYSASSIVSLGAILDFVFGPRVLTFDADWYVFAFKGVPLEEILFYIAAPTAIVLIYAWCDEYWLAAYNRSAERDRLLAGGPPLFTPSLRIGAMALALFGIAVLTKRLQHGVFGVPIYATFLIGAAFVPAAITYRAVRKFVNWRAFGATAAYTIATSLVYEVTLAIPLGWWGYREDATIGVLVESWSRPGKPFPVEAAIVWLAAPFSCVLACEFAKAFLHHPSQRLLPRLRGVR